VASIRSVVVLPASVGAEQAEDPPARHSKSMVDGAHSPRVSS
jgi:hypothetical protein